MRAGWGGSENKHFRKSFVSLFYTVSTLPKGSKMKGKSQIFSPTH